MGIALIIMVMVLTITLQPVLRSIKKILRRKDPTLNSDYQFEDFVCNDVFNAQQYQALHLLSKPGTILTAEEKHKLPDLRLKNLANGEQFYVRCSYHESINHQQIKFCDEQRLQHFKTITEIPVYVFIGIGGPAHFPDNLYMVPLSQLASYKVETPVLEQYSFKFGQNIDFPI